MNATEKIQEKVSTEKKLAKVFIIILLAFAALNAFGGGYYAMAGAEGVPTEWLEGSPFSNYYIPGIFLFFVVGGSFLAALLSVIFNYRHAKMITIGSVVIVYIWLLVQLMIIGYVSWMQPVTASVALLILFLILILHRKMRTTSMKE